MLINDSRILKNGDKIFKSQVVDSFLTNNNPNANNLYIGVSGASIINPLNVYYKTPTETNKYVQTSDNSNWTIQFPTTSETSNKPYYFSGNLDGVYKLDFRNHNSYDYKGDVMKTINQFQNLEIFDIANDSNFNQSLTNASFPRTLRWLSLRDTTLTGDMGTLIGLDNLEYLELYYGGYSGSLSDLGLTNLTYLSLNTLSSLTGDVKEIVNNNPNLYHWYLWNCGQMTGDVTDMDVSNITYMNWYAASNNNITGSMSGWTFNTGMTYLQLYAKEFGGDISNWDISDTNITIFALNNFNYNLNHIIGDLSGWVLPNTLTQVSFYGIEMTSIPQDYSNILNLTSFSCQYCYDVTDDINDIDFTGLAGSLSISYTGLIGNLELFTSPTGVTTLQLRNSNFTGNLSGITIYSGSSNIYLDGNDLSGDVSDMQPFPNALNRLELDHNADVTLNLDAGEFNINGIDYLVLEYISGITGNWSNFVIPTTLNTLQLNQTPISGDISELDWTKITGTLHMHNCSLVTDISNWFTGTTTMTQFHCYNNTELSGDTTNWNVESVTDLRINNTKLSGILNKTSVSLMQMQDTNISSNIETDLGFSSLYYFTAHDTDMVGHLSGVSLYNNFYYFSIYNNPDIYGTNEFIDYLFVNRENWSRTGSIMQFQSIGDSASGATETLGDLGTYGGNQWNLTEAQVNNLVAGIDYTGSGTNVAWNSKEKMYWQKNAQISSTNTTKRYKLINITYS